MAESAASATLARAPGLLSVDGLARLVAVGERRAFEAGAPLMRQGDEASCLHVILAGKVSVAREHAALSNPVILAFLGPGEVVGEMGLLDGEPRSATVIAIEDTVTVEVAADALAECVAEYPQVYAELARVLSRRLRSTDELAAEIVGGTVRPREHGDRPAL